MVCFAAFGSVGETYQSNFERGIAGIPPRLRSGRAFVSSLDGVGEGLLWLATQARNRLEWATSFNLGKPQRTGVAGRTVLLEGRVKGLVGLLQDFCDSFEGPVEFFARDDERRPDADDVIVGFLAEDSFVLEGFAIGASLAVEFDADPQAFAANFFDGRTAERAKPGEEVGSEFGGALHHVFLDEDAQGGSGNG